MLRLSIDSLPLNDQPSLSVATTQYRDPKTYRDIKCLGSGLHGFDLRLARLAHATAALQRWPSWTAALPSPLRVSACR